MKKIAVTTWCTDDYIDYIGLDELRKGVASGGYDLVSGVGTLLFGGLC